MAAPVKYPWYDLAPGDSFFVPGAKRANLRAMSQHPTRRAGLRFSIRTEPAGIRVILRSRPPGPVTVSVNEEPPLYPVQKARQEQRA